MYENKPKKNKADIGDFYDSYEDKPKEKSFLRFLIGLLIKEEESFLGLLIKTVVIGSISVCVITGVTYSIYLNLKESQSDSYGLSSSVDSDSSYSSSDDTLSSADSDSSYSSSSGDTSGSTYSGSSSYSSSMKICPSCGKRVSNLITREVIKGNGDWQSWCSDCWEHYDSISPYSNSEETDYDRALDEVSKAYGISKSELDAAYRAQYGFD